ncbi:MAG: hypothetical protein RL417_680, partial [Pseudomonadota bacterium]
KTVAEQMQRFRDSLEYARHIVDLYPYGSPDVKYVEAIKYLLDELDRAERKNLSVPLHSPAGVPIVAGESTFRVDEITVRRPSAVEKLLTLGSALPQVEELRGVGTGAFSRVDCVEGLLLNLSDLLYWAGEETDYLWEGDRYSGNLRVAGLTPR